jgi:glutamate---cysteine ligase / carboxylate-amine ligase
MRYPRRDDGGRRTPRRSHRWTTEEGARRVRTAGLVTASAIHEDDRMRTRPSAVTDRHRFGVGPSFSLGVEEELLVVDPVTSRARSAAGVTAGRRWSIGTVRPELADSMVELITPICARAGEARDVLALLRTELVQAGTTLLAAGVHPAQPFGEAAPADGARPAELDAMLRGLWRRTPYCGMHVHVGMPDPESAIRASNGMRKWVPSLGALGANSPFWHGRDSGLASTRAALLRSFPRTGVPRAFSSYDDYLRTVADVTAAGALHDYTTIWWDLRVHPRLGTLEVRVPDAQTSTEEAGALAALIHCLVIHEATTLPDPGPSAEQIDECAFRALRDGRRAELYFEGRLRPLNEIVGVALQRVHSIARRLGCSAELRAAERMAEDGNGADRQRAAFAAGGMAALLRHLTAETATAGVRADRPLPLPSPSGQRERPGATRDRRLAREAVA